VPLPSVGHMGGALVHPRAWLERRRARAEADHWIGHGFEARYQWRVAELTSRRERKLSARSLHGILAELDGSKLPGATPTRVAALRPHAALLEAIEARLLDERPVSGAGMLGIRTLLTSPGSCLYTEVDDIASCLTIVLEKLEVH
jgi:hypothetical protein